MMINRHLAENLAGILSAESGLDLRGELISGDNGNKIIISPAGFHPAEGFKIKIQLGWKTINASFVLGNLAKALLFEMRLAFAKNRSIFNLMANNIQENGGILSVNINGDNVRLDNYDFWPETWHYLQINLHTRPIESYLDFGADPGLFSYLVKWSYLFLSLIMTLLPLRDDIEEQDEQIGYVEGIKTQFTGDRYERSRVNRMACIAANGFRCKVCGFDFGETYGQVGEGFIHVHHLIPLSQSGDEGRVFDPVKELVPVCPNCHAMIHKRTPPYSLEEIRLMIKNN